MLSKISLMLRSAEGRVSKHVQQRYSQFPDTLEGRDPIFAWAPAFAGVTEFLMRSLVPVAKLIF